MPDLLLAKPGRQYPKAFVIEVSSAEAGHVGRVTVFDRVCLLPSPLELALKVVLNSTPADAYHGPVYVRLLDGCELPEWARRQWERGSTKH